jgi:hypothetical protein
MHINGDQGAQEKTAETEFDEKRIPKNNRTLIAPK